MDLQPITQVKERMAELLHMILGRTAGKTQQRSFVQTKSHIANEYETKNALHKQKCDLEYLTGLNIHLLITGLQTFCCYVNHTADTIVP